MQGNDEAVVKLVIDASGLRQGSVEAQALGKRIIDSFKAIETAANQVSGAVNVSGAGIVKGLGDTNRFLSQMERGLNPLASAANKAAVEMNRLMGIMGGSNAAAAQRAGQLLELQAKKVLDLKQALFLASGESDRLGSSLTKTVKDAADRLDYLTSKYNQDAVAAKNYRNTIKELNEAIDKGAIGYRQLGIETSKAIDNYNKSTIAGQKMAAGTKRLSGEVHQLGLNTRVAQYALTNFSFQINDVVSGLAMGQQPFRIFAQQAGQFVQIFQQIGRENIGQFFRDMTKEVGNFGAAVGRWIIAHPIVVGLTAIGAGFLLVAGHALASQTRVREFGVILRTMGTDGLAGAKGLEEVVRQLRNTGSAADDASKAVQAIARTPGINPGAVGDIANTARNISAARGIDLGTAATGLSNAIAGGGDALTQYALTLGVKFNPVEQKAIELAILHRDKLEQLRIAYGAITRTMEGEFGKSLSDTTKLVNNLVGSWHTLMDTLGDTKAFQHAVGMGNMLLDVLNKLISRQELYNKKSLEFDLGLDLPSARLPPTGTTSTTLPPISGGSNLTNIPGLQGLAPEFAKGLTNLIAAAAEQGITIGIVSGLRSTERQSQLWLSDIDKNGGRPSGMVARPGGSMHEFGFAADLNRDPRALAFARENASRFGLTFPMQGQRGMPNEPWHIELQGVRGGLTTPTSAGGTALAEQTAAIKLRTAELNKWNLELIQAQALTQATTEAEQKFKEATPENELQKKAFIQNAVNEATAKFNDELNKNIQLEDMRTKGTADAARAVDGGTEAMIRATAEANANLRVKQEGISFEVAYRQELAKGAAEAIKGAAETVAANVPVVKGQRDLAEAAKISGQAEHDVRVQNEANLITQRAVAAATAQGIALDKEAVAGLTAKAKAQILATEAAQNSIVVVRAQNQSQDSVQILQLQGQLLGGNTEQIARQVALLTEKLRLERDTTGLLPQQKEAILAATDAIQRQTVILAERTREWNRFESGIRSMADTIENTLGQAVKDIFDGNKVKSWGETLRTTLSSILSQIVNFTLIKPAIGTALGALGFGNLASQFGTFGGSGGLLSGLFGGNSGTSGTGLFGSTSSNQTGAGETLSTLGNIGGIGKGFFDAFSGGGGGFGSGIGNFLFGSAGVDFGGGGAALGIADAIGGAGGAIGTGIETATAGIFGALPAVSSFLGSVIPFIGPLVGIASLFAGSLFKPKPSNFASGGLLTLGSGGGLITGVNSSGNAQNDAASNQILQGLQSFTKGLLNALPGSSITGNLYTNIGTRDGTIVGGKIGGFSGEMKFGSPQEALNAAQLLVIKSLEGVSDSFKQAAQTLTDPQQVQDFIRFISIYDNLKDAFDSAFANIDADTKKIGPFETALNQLTATFDELTSKANEFGLSLDPINAGLAEAEKRLRIDFVKTMNDVILGFEDPLQLLVDKEKEAGKQRLDDAIAIGASLVEVNKVNALQLDAIWDNQTQSLMDLKEELESGALSGLTIGKQVIAANDNFQSILALVRGGNLGEIANLAPSAQNAFQLSQSAYGNAPQTALLRQSILDAIDKVMMGRTFAEGTESTPEGWIRVGEDGPEWMRQGGGNIILPNDRSSLSPFSDGGGRELISELRQVKELLIVSNNIDRGVGVETVRRLDKINDGILKKKLEENTRTKVA